ncbi:unnamed protein product [Phytophthora fragariaefolia]|uniref:Unnamed protein product n=1 Tax=Phytophthora fragariaefolia TaxID=1490495 RepID=A0A9W6X6E6_9STRA|nr:unnamed protein product [Phytophthora fragariaefolia]
MSTSSAISTTPRYPTSPTASIENVLPEKMVAYSPSKESWMQKNKIYRCVGNAYIVDRVCRRVKKPKNEAILQIMWLDTRFQNAVDVVTIATAQRGIDNYQTLVRLPDTKARRDLTDTMVGGELNQEWPLDKLEIASDLMKKATNDTTQNGLCQRVLRRSKRLRTEDAIFGGASTSLDTVMSLRRFKLIRRCLNFRSEPGMSVKRDPAARIRPLLNLLKCTGSRYVEVGRDLALDEAALLAGPTTDGTSFSEAWWKIPL